MYITTNRVERNKQVQVLAALTSVLLVVNGWEKMVWLGNHILTSQRLLQSAAGSKPH
jgi:hypothetical protein